MFKFLLAKLTIATTSFVVISVGALETAKAATFIDFEPVNRLLPDGSIARDNLAISNQFSSLGVTFGIDNNFDGIADGTVLPMLEKVGQNDNINGFVNGGLNRNDVAAPGWEQRLGNYFLRTGGLGGNGGTLLISYNQATSAASGELWDIDGNNNGQRTEQWEIQALGADLSVIDSITTPLGTNATGGLDGKPFFWSFERDNADIRAIRFKFMGQSDPDKVGLAFDNFSVYSREMQSVPEPASILGLFAVGAFGTISALKRQQK